MFELKELMPVLTGVSITLILTFLGFFWRLPTVIRDNTRAIEKLEKTMEHFDHHFNEIQRRFEASDQIFSELAEKGVSTKRIAEGLEKVPRFPWKNRKVLIPETEG